jgi:hypothetical protein
MIAADCETIVKQHSNRSGNPSSLLFSQQQCNVQWLNNHRTNDAVAALMMGIKVYVDVVLKPSLKHTNCCCTTTKRITVSGYEVENLFFLFFPFVRSFFLSRH